MKRILFAFAIALCSYIGAYSQATSMTIDCQNPGWLSSKIDYADQQTVRNLKVTGYVNTTDLKFIGGLMRDRKLQGCIDLSGANIVGTNGNPDNTLSDYGRDCFGIGKEIYIETLKFPNSLVDAYYVLGDVIFVDSLYWNSNNVRGENFGGGRRTLFCNNLFLGDNVTVIPELAFENGYKLNNVFFSKETTYIGDKSFYRCPIDYTNFSELNKIVYLGEKAFRLAFGDPECTPYSMDTLIIPRSLVEFNTEAFNYQDHEHIFISSSTKVLSSGIMGKGIWEPFTQKELFPDTLFFHMEAATPPYCKFKMQSNYVIYVPKGSKGNYIMKEEWKDANIIEVSTHIKEVSLNNHELTMEVGKEQLLTFSIAPENTDEKNVVWSSSNEDIATVSENGLITALKAGVTWIKVTSVDNPEAMDSCKVTVIQPVTGINISQSSCQLDGIGESVQLEATVLPADATNKELNWKSSNESVCIVSHGQVVAVGYGTAVIIATTVDGGYMATCIVTVTDMTPVSGVDAEAQGYKVYDLQGRECKRLQKGINIIRFLDGTTKKVLVK